MDFKADHFVIALKWKRAEAAALLRLPDSLKRRFTPLIEVLDVDRDEEKAAKRSLENHCDMHLERLSESWAGRPFFLDAGRIIEQEDGGGSGAAYCFTEAAGRDLSFVPVIAMSRSPYEVAAALEHRGRGVALRIGVADVEHEDLQDSVDAFLEEHGLAQRDVDLLLDMGSVHGQPQMVVRTLARTMTESLDLRQWRTLTLLGSSFAQSMQEFEGDELSVKPRTEWLAWRWLQQQHATQKSGASRVPTYGDYGVQHPEIMDGFLPGVMTGSAAIRYTSGDNWVVVKGRSMKQGGDQFRGLAHALIGSPYYAGREHCGGCDDCYQCERNAAGFGALGVWRRIGTMHHITHVTEQLAALHGA